MSLELLKKEAQEVAARMESRLQIAIDDDRELTAEEDTADKADQEKFDKLKAQIDSKERLASRITAVKAASPQITIVKDEREKAHQDPNKRADGFGDIHEFALAVCRATDPHGMRVVDDRLAAPTNFHQESGDGNHTGYLVPAEFRREIWSLVNNEESLLPLTDSTPTSSNQIDMNGDESTPWGSTGIQSYWRSEASQMTPSKLNLDGRSVKLNELYAMCLATDELLQDGPRLSNLLTKGAAEAIRWKQNASIFEGTGVGQPLGFENSGAYVSVAKESGQTATTINAQNVAKMFSRNLNPGRSVWFVNQDVLPQLMTMTLGDQPIWTPPASGFTNAPGGFLFGRPVMFSHHCETLGTLGDIQFVDLKGYFTAYKQGGTQFAESMHLYFDYGVNAFRWVFRFGGQPHLTAPVSPNKGSATKSHFVGLATRA